MLADFIRCYPGEAIDKALQWFIRIGIGIIVGNFLAIYKADSRNLDNVVLSFKLIKF